MSSFMWFGLGFLKRSKMMPTPRVRDVVCPECGYSVMEHAKQDPQTDAPRTREEALDFFEVGGADEGNVLCPECACEFNPKTKEAAI